MPTQPVLIAPSLLSADFGNLHRQIKLAEEGNADWIHLDVMDGHFVPNITFGPPLVKAVRKATRLPLDVHLMIERPDEYLEAFHEAGADLLTVHVEACRHLHRTISRIHDLGMKAGVSLNPATPVSLLSEILPDVDLVLIMSVNPGFGGQSFIPNSTRKIRQAAEAISAANPFIYLEVDGGVDNDTAPMVVESGATVLVSGSHIFGSGDIPAAIRELRGRATAAQQL